MSDIAADPLWDDFRNLALAHSLRACWSTPIFSSDGKVTGTFAMSYIASLVARVRWSRIQLNTLLISQASLSAKTLRKGIACVRTSGARASGGAGANSGCFGDCAGPGKIYWADAEYDWSALEREKCELVVIQRFRSLALRSMSDGGKLVAPDREHPFHEGPIVVETELSDTRTGFHGGSGGLRRRRD